MAQLCQKLISNAMKDWFDKKMFGTLIAFGVIFTVVNHFVLKPGIQHLENLVLPDGSSVE